MTATPGKRTRAAHNDSSPLWPKPVIRFMRIMYRADEGLVLGWATYGINSGPEDRSSLFANYANKD
jgi:hypothetical protein